MRRQTAANSLIAFILGVNTVHRLGNFEEFDPWSLTMPAIIVMWGLFTGKMHINDIPLFGLSFLAGSQAATVATSMYRDSASPQL